MRITIHYTIQTWILLIWAMFAATSYASTEVPLLQLGKKAIYERILTRPGAKLYSTPEATGNGGIIKAFSSYYVYQHQDTNGHAWLRIGTDTRGDNTGWVAEEFTVPWKQQLTLALTNPGTVRDRLLFFKTRSDLEDAFKSPNSGDNARQMINNIDNGQRDARIVAVEPKTFVDINERFYLLPILEHVQTASISGETVRMLKIASVTDQDSSTEEQQAPPPISTPTATGREYTAAIVFVIDSTQSMQKYIRATKYAVGQIYGLLKDAKVTNRVRFGLVAFRAHGVNDRALGYVAKNFVDPSKVKDAKTFLNRVRDLREATASTDYFNEDAFAGVVTALENTKWDDFDARYIVLITDAGSLDGSLQQGQSVESTTGLDAERIASMAGEKQVAITVFHLKTTEGVDDHVRAEDQYRTLAHNSRFQTEAYFPINDGSVEEFSQAVNIFADAIIANVQGEDASVSTQTPSHAAPTSVSNNTIRDTTAALGHAMRLRYMGDIAGTRAPTLFEAWISDRDFTDPTKQTVEVRVLLSKNQLSDLQMVLKKIINAAEAGMLNPDKFFDSLRSLAAQFGRDPNLATDRKATRLADLGLLDEYLNDLPYQSEVMRLTQDTWIGWGPDKQVEFTNNLKRKLTQYEHYNEDWENWVDIAQSGSNAGNFVYPVPLLDMP